MTLGRRSPMPCSATLTDLTAWKPWFHAVSGVWISNHGLKWSSHVDWWSLSSSRSVLAVRKAVAFRGNSNSVRLQSCRVLPLLPAVPSAGFAIYGATANFNDWYDPPFGWQFRTSRIGIEKHERTWRSSQFHFLRGDLIGRMTPSIRVLRQR